MARCIYCNKPLHAQSAVRTKRDGCLCCSENCKTRTELYFRHTRRLRVVYDLGAAFFLLMALTFRLTRLEANIALSGFALMGAGLVNILVPFASRWMIDMVGVENAKRIHIYGGTALVVIGILLVVQ